MCDYSLHSVRSRPARVGDKLVTTNFRTGTRGFASVDDPETAVCVLPGTELVFASEVTLWERGNPARERLPFWKRLLPGGWAPPRIQHRSAIFRQIHKEHAHTHHDALEFPDGTTVLLTFLHEGQQANVLQLPARPRNAEDAKEQERVPIAA
jgi:hypothetical protein